MLKRCREVLLWRWRRNPLKRRSDVAEAWVGLATVAAVLFTAPTVGVTAAAVAERSALTESQGLRHVTAKLVEDAPAATVARFSGAADDQLVRATVRWTTDGSSTTGTARVAAGREAGSRTTVWLDASDRVHPAPPTAAQARAQGVVTGTSAAVGAALLVLGLRWAARVRLDRRRWAQWDRDWAAFEAHRGQRHA
ncbi:hypothetical protein [Streptomyces sp. 11x1]|uniref:Rv1733c family protein n=1 Tax=Streptomyces sp. 11x1 TaxID=3038642 RepID=UPI00292E59A3|nr:hypothetical protein [Streptomyces sp. 11x1]WNZ13167.1 hypothetical protein P8T65_40120 [Streptomyces sp. 11x1]